MRSDNKLQEVQYSHVTRTELRLTRLRLTSAWQAQPPLQQEKALVTGRPFQ
jgi:hypothetical protein